VSIERSAVPHDVFDLDLAAAQTDIAEQALVERH
jgi:hypothetical protein